MTPGRSSSSELIERVLSGDAPDLARLAAEGTVPLPEDELIALQVALASAGTGDVAATAGSALAEMAAERVAGVIADGASPDVLRWFAAERREPAVLEAIVRRRDAPHDLLASLARTLSPKLQEVLLVRQDAIVEYPEILDALEANPQLSSYARRRAKEYREHLIPVEEPAPEEEEEHEGEASEEEVRTAVEEASKRELPADRDGKGEREETTGLSEAQIRTLPVPVRRKLARTTKSRSLRVTLLHDPNPQVAVTAMSGANLSDGEVEKLCASRSVVGDVLEEIARRRDWISKYKVVSALVHNPRTPVGLAVRLLSRVSVRELRMLSRDHNVSNAVRTHAQRLYRMKRR